MAKKEKAQKLQKPLYKKWWFWVIVVCLVGAAGSGLSGGDKPVEPGPSTSQTPPAETKQEPEAPPAETSQAPADSTPETSELPAETEPEPDAREALDDALGGTTFYENVRNDVTGKWRVLVFYSAENIVDHAVEYYNAYFSADDEIHIAVNLGLKTTSVMNVSGGGMYVSVHEYIDKEEHDAKVLGGGDLLKSYTVNLETGEIEDVSAAE